MEKTVDIKTYKGLTPLMVALEENCDPIFQWLLNNGADLPAQDDEGNTILHRAIMIKDSKKARMLIKNNVNVHERSFVGETPVMMAVRCGLMDVVRALVLKGADLFEKNHKGDSLLHMAARVDHTEIIGYLLDKGLPTQDRNNQGQRPCDIAVRDGIRQLLAAKNTKERQDIIRNKEGFKRKRRVVPSEKGQESEDEEDRDKQRAHLLNEEMVKYRVARDEDNIGSMYKDGFGKYQSVELMDT